MDLLGRWHQMLNDMVGWSRDLKRGTPTYFLSEGAEQAGPGGSIAEWVISEGYAWAMDQLRPWMAELRDSARELSSPNLVRYLEQRDEALLATWEDLRRGMEPLQQLARSLRGASTPGIELRDPAPDGDRGERDARQR